MDEAYWHGLADDYVTAYGRIFGVFPSKETLLLVMPVAEAESQSGRTFLGANNFGAIQLRRLTPDEQASYDAGTLRPGARVPGNPGGVLQIDTTPTPQGPKPYPVWFAMFPTQVDGIVYYLKVLLKHRPSCFNVVNNPAGTLAELAKAQYVTGYFEGVHAGARVVGHRTDPLTVPEQANVDDYTAFLTRASVKITPFLADWEPQDNGPPTRTTSQTLPTPPFNLTSIRGYQAALTYLAVKLQRPEWNPDGVDGVHGAETDKAIRAFQSFEGIGVDGDVGDETIQHLESALAMVT